MIKMITIGEMDVGQTLGSLTSAGLNYQGLRSVLLTYVGVILINKHFSKNQKVLLTRVRVVLTCYDQNPNTRCCPHLCGSGPSHDTSALTGLRFSPPVWG